MDAIELLTRQHRVLEDLLGRLLATEDPDERKTLFAHAADELTVHVLSEEQVFYPAVRARRTEDVLLESLEEHLSLKRLLADLVELDPAARTFEPKVEVLKEQAEHHHEEEEEHLFPKVRALLDADQIRDLGEKMAALQRSLRREGAPREGVAEQTDRAAPLQPPSGGE